MGAQDLDQQVRRLVGIRSVSFAVAWGCPVFWGAWLVGGAAWWDAALSAAFVSMVAWSYSVFKYRLRPPSTALASRREPVFSEPPAEPDSDDDPDDPPAVAAALAMADGALMGAAALVFALIVPALVIGAFWIAHDDATGWEVLAALLGYLLVVTCLEYGFEQPLCRRWGLPDDDTWARSG